MNAAKTARRYAMRLNKWRRYLAGKSYQHHPQDRGKVYFPNGLEGYFNDLTAKATWSGALGKHGVPAVTTDTVAGFEFPIAIFQWGLGNWDEWLVGGKKDSSSLERALAAGRWAISEQTPDGGWVCWTGLQRPVSSPFSAMAQGQGLSLLARLSTISDDPNFELAAERAIHFLEAPSNGLVVDRGAYQSLEEYPGGAIPAVLNGWIFALMGIHDGALRWSGISQLDARSCVASLVAALGDYDRGYWSNYDLKGTVASPFYHRLHIAQLLCLSETFGAHRARLHDVALQYERYAGSIPNVARSLVVKTTQKLAQIEMGEME